MTGPHEGNLEFRKKFILKIINERYVPDTKIALNNFFKNFGNEVNLTKVIMSELRDSIEHPILFTNYSISPEIIVNNEKVRKMIKRKMNSLPAKLNVKQLIDFLTLQHECIKQAQNRWLVANPGTMLEIFTIPLNANERLLCWLEQKYNVKSGDEVVHRHAISGHGRERLRLAGLEVSYSHWDRQYVIDGLKKAAQLVASNPYNKGLLGMGSWMYNPGNYKKASDGKPFVAFTFLSCNRLTGSRINLGEATNDNEFRIQYAFATQNSRRYRLAEAGEFKPRVYGTFYPRKKLLSIPFVLR